MPLKGLTKYFNPLAWTSFSRSGWVQPEGSVPAYIHEARVFNVNMVNWTVDVSTIFDRKQLLDLQVSSPYMNPNQGEGIYCVPEVGSKCLVCIPSDGPPPFVLAFIMPMVTQQLPDTGEDTDEKSGYTYAGGRKRGKPGDIVMRGRDGNFMLLHRGGVAQFGSGPLAQRICIPLQNLVTDISQNYNHFNGACSLNWGVQDRGSKDPTAECRDTYRIYANDEFADIRVDMGYVRAPTGEPVGDAGEDSNNNQLGIGTSEQVVFEFALAKNGFETDAGEFQAKPEDVKLRIFIDRAGNMMGRWEGSVNLRVKKKLRLTVDEDITIFCKKNVSLTAEGSVKLIGKKGAEVGTGGGALALNGGGKAVAHVGSVVKVSIAIPLQVATPNGPGTVLPGQFIEGVITSGNPTILV
ncbi:MAG: hypothetical protein WC372_11390 [Candidatus Neomarinimicrobiota bacterium]|jgi:hypothetical protein